MKRLKRSLAHGIPAALGIAVVMATAVSSATAADGIPRPPGAIDNRGYELVSQADKNGNHVGFTSLLSPSGDRVMYDVVGGVPGMTSGARPKLVAQRTDAGWVSHGILPESSAMPGAFYLMAATNPELTAGIAASFAGGLGTNTSTPDVSLVRLNDAAQQSLLFHFPVFFGAGGPEVVASTDLSHIYSNVPEPIAPSHQPGTGNVYDFATDPPTLISAMPGTNLAPTCGLPIGGSDAGFAKSTSSTNDHWVSDNGAFVFFISQGDDAPACGAPTALYRRDVEAGTTMLVSGPVLAGDPDNGVYEFARALSDGSAVYYRTQTSLDPQDDVDANTSDMDLYRWTPGGGNVCQTCFVPAARLSAGQGTNLAVSDDGSTAYFGSRFPLSVDAPAGNAPGGTPNLYVLRDGALRFIVRTEQILPQPGNGGQVTPDGNVLIFRSNTAGLNAESGSDNQGLEQYYRYDYDSDSVTCLSCSPDGLAVEDVPQSMQSVASTTVLQNVRVVTDDGSMVVFPTSTPLVPEDVNQRIDLYEWHSGVVKLITDGVTQSTQSPLLATISPDGHDILFQDVAKLTTQVQDGAKKLYDARIDGGFPPLPTPPAACAEDQCMPEPVGSPDLLTPSTASLLGTGNVIPGRPARFTPRPISGAQLTHMAETGKLTLKVRVSGSGRVSALARAKIGGHRRIVARASEHARGAGTVALRLRLSDAAQAALATTGRLRVVLAVGFSRAPVGKRLVFSLKATAHDR